MVVAAVEGQKVGLLAPQPGRHPHLIRVHGKVNKRTLLEREEKIPLVPLVLVLTYRMSGALSGQRVLELGGDNRNTVDRKRHVDDAATVLAVCLLHDRGEGDLARDRQPVPGVVLRRFGIHSSVRPKIGHAEGLAVAFKPVAQDVQRALELQLLRETVQHGYGGLWP